MISAGGPEEARARADGGRVGRRDRYVQEPGLPRRRQRPYEDRPTRARSRARWTETHRSADRFEVLSLFTYKARGVRPSEHARTAILIRAGYKDQTDHTSTSSSSSSIGSSRPACDTTRCCDNKLQRCSMRPSSSTNTYVGTTSASRSYEGTKVEGRTTPSLMLQHILTMMIEWDVNHEEAAERLAEGDIHFEPETLRVELCATGSAWRAVTKRPALSTFCYSLSTRRNRIGRRRRDSVQADRIGNRTLRRRSVLLPKT